MSSSKSSIKSAENTKKKEEEEKERKKRDISISRLSGLIKIFTLVTYNNV